MDTAINNQNLVPIRVSKVTSSDDCLSLYIPKEAQKVLGLEKGKKVIIYVDHGTGSLVVRKRSGGPL